MHALAKALDMELHFTSRYHLEADEQMECANQTLEQYIRIYCSYQQDNWDLLLPIAEFAYNNALNASTGISPFFANKGYHPNITVHPERDIASARACDFVVNLDELHQFLCDKICGEIPWPIRNHSSARLPFLHPQAPIGPPCDSPCLPCITT